MKKSKKIDHLINEVNHLKGSFAKKIKSPDEIKKIIGKRPRKKKVVMCHGTFDIVHPGHIRQLIYSKSKGDILLVSIITDKHISKRSISPYVPQELRALNLAAFEIVDYVIIDENPTPIKNITKLQPDFFVKGFEYLGQHHSNTDTEIEALKEYGGKLIFSPGDIIYSSSKLLSTQKPNLSLDQLLVLMDAEKIDFCKLKKTVKAYKGIKIHVVGDVIVDKYSECTILGPASGSTAFSVRLDNTKTFIGGAGVVAKHLKFLGADVTLTTVLGKDKEADYVFKNITKSGIKLNAIIDSPRPTTVKQRFIDTGSGQKLIQIDTVDNTTISDNIIKKICISLKKSKVEAVVFSDFRHGIFNSKTIPQITKFIPNGTVKIADSQVSNRWGNILDFPNFDLLTPNEKEARFAMADQETPVRPLAEILYKKAKCKYLILKLGENGLITHRGLNMGVRNFFYIDSFVDKLVDSVGAGDALLSAATLTLASTRDIVQASILGNICAAYECSKLGNVPATQKGLIEMINDLEKKI